MVGAAVVDTAVNSKGESWGQVQGGRTQVGGARRQQADADASGWHLQGGPGKGETPQGNRRVAGGGWRWANQGAAGTAAAEQPHTLSQGSGAVEQVQMETQVSQLSLPAPQVTSPTQRLTHEKQSPSLELPIF